jgi:taurine transport system ATP-binding protein
VTKSAVELKAAVGAPFANRGLRLSEVAHEYRTNSGTVSALAGIDLEVWPGEFVCIVGQSGCGKSTLLELVAGLRLPTVGSVELDGRRIVGTSRNRGVVFQQSTSLYPWLTVRGNVELGLKLQRTRRSVMRERAEREISLVGLADFAEHKVYELSGGMQQRCQIARALAADPEILLMDEPFGALDALTRENLQNALRSIWRDTGRTVLFVTHSVEEAVLLGSRVIVMSPRPGRIISEHQLSFSSADLPAAELRKDPEFVRVCHSIRNQITSS